MTLRFLRRKFGELPPALVDRVERAEASSCESLMDLAMEADTVEGLGAAWTG